VSAMICGILIGTTLMSGGTVDSGVAEGRSFLMLNDQSIEFVDGTPVLGHWATAHRWDATKRQSIEIVDGAEFVIDKQFWKMVRENGARHAASSEVRLERDGRLFYRGKPVDLGLRVGHLESVLRWRNWIVAVGTAADPTRSTIKGPIWYLFWFDERSLKGSYREVSTVVAPPLRIYSK
jgi:hypothetical protein